MALDPSLSSLVAGPDNQGDKSISFSASKPLIKDAVPYNGATASPSAGRPKSASRYKYFNPAHPRKYIDVPNVDKFRVGHRLRVFQKAPSVNDFRIDKVLQNMVKKEEGET